MDTPVIDREELAGSWRASASADNPAGPLFTSRYAEADLTNRTAAYVTCGTDCSGSHTIYCC